MKPKNQIMPLALQVLLCFLKLQNKSLDPPGNMRHSNLIFYISKSLT